MRLVIVFLAALWLSPQMAFSSGAAKKAPSKVSAKKSAKKSSKTKKPSSRKKTVSRKKGKTAASLGIGVVPRAFQLHKKNSAGAIWRHPKYKRSVITLQLDQLKKARTKPAPVESLRLGFYLKPKSLGGDNIKSVSFKQGKTKKGQYAYEISNLTLGKKEKFRLYQLVTWRGKKRHTWNYLAHSSTPKAEQKATWTRLFTKAVNR